MSLPAAIGPYQVLGLLGRGGMAEVFRVRASSGPLVGREVALKRLLPSRTGDALSNRLFTDEAELTRFLHHPNIVEVHDFGFDDDSTYLVMELIDGPDVSRILKRCRERQVQWPIDFAVYLTVVLLNALAHAHAVTGPTGKLLRLVHCDISPSNFFVSRTGDLKLGDFGVARSLLAAGSDEVLGKPYYLSPEALEGHLEPALDLWSTAVFLYELLTLKRPFVGRSRDEVFAAIRSTTWVRPSQLRPDVPPLIGEVLERAFAPRLADRFASASEFADALMPLYDSRIGTPLAISAIARGLFGPDE